MSSFACRSNAALCVAALAAAAPVASGVVVPGATHAAVLSEGIIVSPHVRTRFVRHDGRDGNASNDVVEYFEQRARIAVDFDVVEYARVFVQLQDVRVWGEEANTLADFSANGFDAHQAYVDLRLPEAGLTLRLGRQAIDIDEQRFMGAVEWTPQGRSFDAARLTWKALDDALKVDAMYSLVTDVESIAPGPPSNANTATLHLAVLGFRYDHALEGLGKLENSVYAFYEDVEKSKDWRLTAGARHAGALDLFRYRLEGWIQTGDSPAGDIQTFMLGAYAGVHLADAGALTILGWFDYLSGADDPAEGARRTFDPRYGTNHIFYGMADFFLNLPVDTQGKGLMDMALKISAQPVSTLTLDLHGHYMMTAQAQGGPDDFGTEIDFVATWNPLKEISAQLAVFAMLPGEALKLRIGGDDLDLGIYATIGATL